MEGVGPRLERECPTCKGRDMVEVHSEGDIVCRGCGLVVEAHIIDERSEWRTFGDKDKEGDDPSRVGGATNVLLDDGGLGTMIGRVAGDGGASFALNKMHMRQNNQMRHLKSAFGGIGEMCSKLNQSEAVKAAACEIYKNVHDNKVLKGRKNDLVYAACVLVASRQVSNPLQFKELGALFRNNMPPGTSMTTICKQLYACYKGINELQQTQALETAAQRAARAGGAAPTGLGSGGGAAAGGSRGGAGGVAGASANAESVMPRCLSALGFGNREIVAAKRIAQAVLKLGQEQQMPWSGKNPMTVAGAIIWGIVQLEQMKAAGGAGGSSSSSTAEDDRAINEVSGATGMAPITIREGFRDMLPVWYQEASIVPDTYATKQQLEALGRKLGVDVTAAVDAGTKAGRKKKKQKTG